MSPSDLKSEILRLTREYSRIAHTANRPGDDPGRPEFVPGQTIPYAGRVFTEDEVEAAVSATLDFWLTLGPEGEAMEKELAAFMGVKHSLLVNSGSSANLVAFAALTTHKLPEHKRIRPGDEVITVAAGFPTTVTPIIQCGAVPVFIDAKTTTGNADCSMLEAAYSPGKTKAVMMAHALGNPFELVTVLEFCKKYDLWLIEDNCDALGCTYTLPLEKAKELGLDHLIKIAETGEHPIIRIEQPRNDANEEDWIEQPRNARNDANEEDRVEQPRNARNDANEEESSANLSCGSRASRFTSGIDSAPEIQDIQPRNERNDANEKESSANISCGSRASRFTSRVESSPEIQDDLPRNARNDANEAESSPNLSCGSRASRFTSGFDSSSGFQDDQPRSARNDANEEEYQDESSKPSRASRISRFNSSEPMLTAPTGSFGDLSTQSFYPPHHLTMGEGGAVNIIRKPALKTYAESFRDWGRDCWCPSGKDDTCKKRFQWQLGELPEGYDHKYIYSHLGYNLKPLDPQAAIGRVQLRRLPEFIEARKRNWERLRLGLHGLEDVIDFALPTHATAWLPPEEYEQPRNTRNDANENLDPLNPSQASLSDPSDISCASRLNSEMQVEQPRNTRNDANEEDDPILSSNISCASRISRLESSSFTWDSTGCRTDCSWFGFKMTIKESAPFTRTELARELDRHKIGNRMLFGGNLVRQPAFVQLKRDNPNAFRVVDEEKAESRKQKAEIREGDSSADASLSQISPLPAADRIMNQTIFLGTYPGLTKAQIDYMVTVIREFVESKK